MAEDRVEELKSILQQNEVSVANAHEALEHHLNQLHRIRQPWKITCVKSSGK